MEDHLVFLDVDTQEDFMLPQGALYISGADEIVPNLAKLMAWAREHGVPVLSTADAHEPDDPSFAQWPPHCVVGTAGQRRIPDTQFPSPTVVANRPGSFAQPSRWSGQTIIEKSEYDVSTNPNFNAILSSLCASLAPCRFVVFGVATDYCVRSAALGLRERGLSVDLVTDAIKPVTAEGGRKAIEEMAKAGVRFVKTAEIVASTKARATN